MYVLSVHMWIGNQTTNILESNNESVNADPDSDQHVKELDDTPWGPISTQHEVTPNRKLLEQKNSLFLFCGRSNKLIKKLSSLPKRKKGIFDIPLALVFL